MALLFPIRRTPQRLLDLLENHGLTRDMKVLDSLIFDEADQLLEMGFRPAIENILRKLQTSKVFSLHLAQLAVSRVFAGSAAVAVFCCMVHGVTPSEDAILYSVQRYDAYSFYSFMASYRPRGRTVLYCSVRWFLARSRVAWRGLCNVQIGMQSNTKAILSHYCTT